jgi:DNA primase
MDEPVANILTKYEIYYRTSGKDYIIRCLNPDHDDKNPSMRVDRFTGIFHCFSCGFKGNLFKHFGLLTTNNSVKIAKLKEKLKDLHINFNGVDFPHEKIPLNRTFRGISINTLKEFEAFYTTGSEELSDRAWFPIHDIRGKIAAYVGRHMLSSGNPRYLNFPRGTTLPCFPEQMKVKSKNLVLVEGIFDLLNLYDKGLKNVACTFGTTTLVKDTALKLLPFRTQGVTKIYLMYDGDVPGQEAAHKLKPLLEAAEYEVEVITLEEDKDPGDLSQDEVNSIKEWIDATRN